MKKFTLGTKDAMTRIFQPDGTAVPVTRIIAGPVIVVQVKKDNAGDRTAVQIGFGARRRLKKPQAGALEGLGSPRYLREFRVRNAGDLTRGATLDVTQFAPGDRVRVTGTSKGRGFAGVVKRHGFHGSPATHGHKDQHRMPGSIGSTAPQRVFKGTRMAGRMGNARVTVRNLEVMRVEPTAHALLVKGAVPGPRNGLLLIQTAESRTP